MRKGLKAKLRTGVFVGAVLVISGCSEVIRNHGYIPNQEDLDTILVGVDTRETVEIAVGRPSTSGVLEQGAWYYIGNTYRHYAYRKPQEIDRQVVAISFADDGVVENIERFGLEDGQVVTLSRRVTESTVREPGFIRQLLRNVGQINIGEALGG